MSKSYEKVLDRLAVLLKTGYPEHELSMMAELQREMQPHLSEQVSFDLVILGIIKTYEDYDLDFYWSQYMQERALALGNPEAA